MGKPIDLTGQKFGKLTVMEIAPNPDKNGRKWKCRCDCGNEIVANAGDLKKGHTKSCGCLRKERNAEDLTGKRFCKLMVEKRIENKGKNTMWLCVCDCGNTVEVNSQNLKSGNTQSCGCLHSEMITESNYKHGLSRDRIYSVWSNMKQRCFNPKVLEYSAYGGRGITVCEEWRNDFKAFYDYVSKLPHFGEEGRSIDRINNNGNYEPGNVRWATSEQQYANRGY